MGVEVVGDVENHEPTYAIFKEPVAHEFQILHFGKPRRRILTPVLQKIVLVQGKLRKERTCREKKQDNRDKQDGTAHHEQLPVGEPRHLVSSI